MLDTPGVGTHSPSWPNGLKNIIFIFFLWYTIITIIVVVVISIIINLANTPATHNSVSTSQWRGNYVKTYAVDMMHGYVSHP
jgi:heme/copper-type cytochrome/quinol oxidase subunit 2